MTDIAAVVAEHTNGSLGDFGISRPCNDLQVHLALDYYRGQAEAIFEVIRHLGVTFETEDPEVAVDALGRLCVYASIVAEDHLLAIGPIIDLARVFCASGDAPANHAAGKMAELALSDDPTPDAVVHALARCISRATDDCEMIFDLKIDILGVFMTVGGEIVAESAHRNGMTKMTADAGHEVVAAAHAAMVSARADVQGGGLPMAETWQREVWGAIERQEYEDAVLATGLWCPSDAEVRAQISRSDHETAENFAARVERVMTHHRKGQNTGLPELRAHLANEAAARSKLAREAVLRGGVEDLLTASQTEIGDFEVQLGRRESEDAAIRKFSDYAALRRCPTCTAQIDAVSIDRVRCPAGHEFTFQELIALKILETE